MADTIPIGAREKVEIKNKSIEGRWKDMVRRNKWKGSNIQHFDLIESSETLSP